MGTGLVDLGGKALLWVVRLLVEPTCRKTDINRGRLAELGKGKGTSGTLAALRPHARGAARGQRSSQGSGQRSSGQREQHIGTPGERPEERPEEQRQARAQGQGQGHARGAARRSVMEIMAREMSELRQGVREISHRLGQGSA